MAEKMRVHILAKELSVPSKVIVEKCKAEGIDSVKNHMSTLSAGLHATIREWFSEGSHNTTIETAQRVDLKKVRVKRARKNETPASTAEGESEKARKRAVAVSMSTTTVEAPTGTSDVSTAAPATAVLDPPVAETAEQPLTPTVVQEPSTPETEAAVAEAPPVEAHADVGTEAVPVADVGLGAPEAPVETLPTPPEVVAPASDVPKTEPKPITPAGPQNVPAKAKLQGPRVVRYEAMDYAPAPLRRRTLEPRRDTPAGGPASPPPVVPATDKPADRVPTRKKGRLSTRRATGRLLEAGERLAEWGDRDLAERRERLAGATGRRIRRRTAPGGGRPIPAGPKTVATVHEPIRMKEFCSATGLNFIQCFKVLKDEHSVLANVNMTLPVDTAELLSLHFGIELTVIPCKTRLDELKEEYAARERHHLLLRSPVVTMLGHVDHGKTSLLDAIRNTRVVDGEEGGITQHIGAYRIETPHGPVTFLDTPGHKAFTNMRARGAQLTDVVVLVVAADDGVMPQTVEAINHAKAAEVPIVVALNKIDLGEQNKVKIYARLSELDLTPSGDWGGEVDVIPTSASTGVGVQELVEHLADLSSLLDLKTDATLPACGTAIEAETKPGVGAVVHLLVEEGTLRVGDTVVCGPAFGKVRALLTDRGQRIPEAGPTLPVEVWGLDEVPSAGDKLYTVETLQRAKDIATETKQMRIEKARIQSQKVKTLEEMVLKRDSEGVPELNIIVKADVDGSIEALRQVLADIPSDEVKLTFRHVGVGTVNDSDVLLAAACRGIVVAFRVDAAVGVRRLAERNGVDIRSYRVIYDVADEIRKALEGLLEPEERMEARATAEVRQLFRLSKKAGVVAGSFVLDGLLNRNHVAKVLRDGVIVREGSTIASLRRFKDDVKEVRGGMECGIRLDGFDDLHVGDVIETYEVVKVARKL